MPQTSIEKEFDQRRIAKKYPSGMKELEVAEALNIHVRTLRNKEKLELRFWQVGMLRKYLDLTGISEEKYTPRA